MKTTKEHAIAVLHEAQMICREMYNNSEDNSNAECITCIADDVLAHIVYQLTKGEDKL